MKSLVRQIATVSLIGATAVGGLMASAVRVLAMSADQIAAKLGSVPVFIVINDEGRSLTATITDEDSQEVSAPLVFIDGQDAENFLSQARNQNAPFASEAEIVPVWLGALYEQASAQQTSGSEFAYIPTEDQVESANSIRNGFSGVPLFVAWDSSQQAYLTVTQNGESVVPMFFNRSDLDALLQRFRESEPEAAANIEVGVLPLEGVIREMEADTSPELNQIQLVPSSDVIEYFRTRQ